MKIKWTGYKSETVYHGLCKDGMIIEWNAPITMDDGAVLRADVFRPLKEGRYPVIISFWRTEGPLLPGDKHFRSYICEIKEEMEGSSTRYMTFEVPDPRGGCRTATCACGSIEGCGCSPGTLTCGRPGRTATFISASSGPGPSPGARARWACPEFLPCLEPVACGRFAAAAPDGDRPWEGGVDWYRIGPPGGMVRSAEDLRVPG